MNMKLDALMEEVDQDTLAKLALATTAGVITAAAARKLYKKYKEKKILNKYTSQEDGKHQSLGDEIRSVVPDIIDANTARRY
jgi:hypothetical protein